MNDELKNRLESILTCPDELLDGMPKLRKETVRGILVEDYRREHPGAALPAYLSEPEAKETNAPEDKLVLPRPPVPRQQRTP